jgi:hypothetical protein
MTLREFGGYLKGMWRAYRKRTKTEKSAFDYIEWLENIVMNEVDREAFNKYL